MLSIDAIARVAVNVIRSAAQPAVFDTGLLLAKDSSFTSAKRLKSYASSAEAAAGLVADGLASSTEAYKAAHKAVPIQVPLTLAGSLESIVITVNVRA